MPTPTSTKLIEAFGWFGTVCVFGAYILTSNGWLPSTGVTFQLLNLVGGIGIATVSYTKRNYQPFALNFIWSIVAVIAIARAVL